MKRLLDIIVASQIVVALVEVPIAIIISKMYGDALSPREILGVITWTYPIIPVITALGCLSMLLWMGIGDGARSSLWRWLPPLVLLRTGTEFQRWFFVLALVTGGLMGVIATLTTDAPNMSSPRF